MAFTLAHMAAALPFYPVRRWLQFEALLIGTMMPDLHYFLDFGDSFSRRSHEWIGLLTYSLPWGLLLFALWHWVLKPATFPLVYPFIKGYVKNPHDQQYLNANDGFYNRKRFITDYSDNYWSYSSFKKRAKHWLSSFWLSVVFGLILGATTHLVWDGITHPDGFIAQRIAWLQYPLYFYPFKGTTISRLLQYLSSMSGLLVLFWFVISYLQIGKRNNSNLNKHSIELDDAIEPVLTKKQSLLIIGSIIMLSLVWSMKTVLRWYPSLTSSPYTFSARISVSLIQDFGMLFIGYAIIYHIFHWLRSM